MVDTILTAFAGMSANVVFFSIAVLLLAGIIKGVSGFALPLTILAGLSFVLPAQTVVATIAFPALVSNFLQAQRTGAKPAMETFREYWLLNLILVATVFACTRLVVTLDEQFFFLILGVGAFSLGVLQALGWPRRIPENLHLPLQVPFGLVAGFFGGLAGIWGAALLIYYLSLRLKKTEFVRAVGVSYFVASIPYVVGHLRNGVLNFETAQLSLLALIPTLIGLGIGQAIQDRLNQTVFRRVVLAILLLMTLNLVRRGIWG